jgi:hypothetical protein
LRSGGCERFFAPSTGSGQAAAGEKALSSRVSPSLWQALADAQRAACWSDGLVTPLVLPALEATGYDRSFAELAPQTAEQAGETPVVDWRELKLHRQRRVWFPAAARLDLAGTLKGSNWPIRLRGGWQARGRHWPISAATSPSAGRAPMAAPGPSASPTRTTRRRTWSCWRCAGVV